MKWRVLSYGAVGGLLITLLQWTEYRFLVVEHSVELYGGLVAAIFAGLGIWLGMRLTGRRQVVFAAVLEAVTAVPATAMPVTAMPEKKPAELGMTRREFEIWG